VAYWSASTALVRRQLAYRQFERSRQPELELQVALTGALTMVRDMRTREVSRLGFSAVWTRPRRGAADPRRLIGSGGDRMAQP
jgi:hypothetical protein